MRKLLASGSSTDVTAGLIALPGTGIDANGMIPNCDVYDAVQMEIAMSAVTAGALTLLMFGFSMYADDFTTPQMANASGIADAASGNSAAVRFTAFSPGKALVQSGLRFPHVSEGGAGGFWAFMSKSWPPTKYIQPQRFTTGAPGAITFAWKFYGLYDRRK